MFNPVFINLYFFSKVFVVIPVWYICPLLFSNSNKAFISYIFGSIICNVKVICSFQSLVHHEESWRRLTNRKNSTYLNDWTTRAQCRSSIDGDCMQNLLVYERAMVSLSITVNSTLNFSVCVWQLSWKFKFFYVQTNLCLNMHYPKYILKGS